MSREDEYRSLAAAALDQATSTTDLAGKLRGLLLASGWLDLAERSKRRLQHPEPTGDYGRGIDFSPVQWRDNPRAVGFRRAS